MRVRHVGLYSSFDEKFRSIRSVETGYTARGNEAKS